MRSPSRIKLTQLSLNHLGLTRGLL
jgi:hypothetical protein